MSSDWVGSTWSHPSTNGLFGMQYSSRSDALNATGADIWDKVAGTMASDGGSWAFAGTPRAGGTQNEYKGKMDRCMQLRTDANKDEDANVTVLRARCITAE